jgi:hypothetical protein
MGNNALHGDMGGRPKGMEKLDEQEIARRQWARYEAAKSRGHAEFCLLAKLCENMYLGGNRQWSPDDKAYIESQGLPLIEFNGIMPAVDSAAGYQIHNRLEIAAVPVGGKSDAATAETLSKVIKQIMNSNDYARHETQVFMDGEIQGRGYFEILQDYEDTVMGRVKIGTLDGMDVIPDPDAKSYDPDDWADVQILRWMTKGDIAQRYGDELAAHVANEAPGEQDTDFGESDFTARRNRFGMESSSSSYESQYFDDEDVRRYRVIDRQYFVRELCLCAIYNENDVRVVEGLPDEKLAEFVSEGAILAKRVMKRIRWTVTTMRSVLFDGYSRYAHFTVVPFFYKFRRGLTMGMVENAIGPQVAYNKAATQFLHNINSSSNSGFDVEQGSITNMTMEEFEERAGQNGLITEYAKGSTPPQKRLANPIPQGIAEMMNVAQAALKESTVPDVARGLGDGVEVSGIALQTKQFAAQQQLAIPLDNLARTRQMVGKRIISIIQRFYTYSMVVRITEQDPNSGKDIQTELALNQPMDDGSTFNDLSAGDYDVALNEQPTTVTYGNSQFQQVMELINAGVPIPPDVALKYSMLADKFEIMTRMSQQNQEAPADPTLEAKANLLRAQAEQAAAQTASIQAATVQTSVETMFTATQAAQVITGDPATSPLSDKLLGSAGFVDRDPGSIVPLYQGGAISSAAAEVGPGVPAASAAARQTTATPRLNTNPEFTPQTQSPMNGMNGGIETLRADSVR